MKTLFKLMLLGLLALALLATLAGVAIWQEVGQHPAFSITINGSELELQELSAAHWGSALFGLMVAGLVVLLIVPLVLLLGLGLPLLIVGGVATLLLAGALGLGALLCSPLILLALLVIWLLRRDARQPRAG